MRTKCVCGGWILIIFVVGAYLLYILQVYTNCVYGRCILIVYLPDAY